MWQVLPEAATWLIVGVTVTFPVFSFYFYPCQTWGLLVHNWNDWNQLPYGWISLKDWHQFLHRRVMQFMKVMQVMHVMHVI